MNLFTKQKQTHRLREQTNGYQWGEKVERIVREFGTDIHIAVFKMDNQQGLTVQHRERHSMSYNNYNGKEFEKEYVYIYKLKRR